MADTAIILDRWGPLSFPVLWGSRLYHAWDAPPVQTATSILGTAVLLFLLYRILFFVWDNFLRPGQLQVYCHAEAGSWALVTGASDGIGYAFADQLLGRGFNVLLHGRNPQKLEGIRAELAQRYPKRAIETVIADATSTDYPEDIVAERARTLPGKLTVLVNNVGGINVQPSFALHSEHSAHYVDSCINLNARFPTQLTRALLPLLRENKPSLVMFSGSGAGLMHVPYLATYSATKAFLHALAASIQTEMLADGGAADVEVLAFVIGNVLSGANKSNMPLITITSAQCVRGCLDKVGCGRAITHGHWRHALQDQLTPYLVPPRTMKRALITSMRQRMEEERKGT